MEPEAVQTPAHKSIDFASRCGTMGTLTFLPNDPRPLAYVLEDVAFSPIPPPSLTKNWDTHIADVKRLQLRDDDIVICAYPKAGTHWLWEVMAMLTKGKAEYDKRPKEELMLEFTEGDKLDKMPSPRILNSHLPFYLLPWQQMKEKRTKILHVYRNPKDSCVSYYYHLKVFKESPIFDMGFNDFCEIFFCGILPFNNYFWHMKQVAKFIEDNPDVPILSLSFEDMKKNPSENVKRLARFLQLEAGDKLCEDIAEACGFNNLKRGAKLKKEWGDRGNETEEKGRPIEFYRKGEIGDWKDYFTVALSERMDAVIKEKMEGLPYVLQYS